MCVSQRFKRIQWLVILASAVSCGSTARGLADDKTNAPKQEAVPTASEILNRLRESRDLLENAVIESNWEEVWDGTLKSWEEQTFYWDNVGRRRIVFRNGTLGPNGAKLSAAESPQWVDIVFNGEILVDQRYFPNRDRAGAILKNPTEAAGYRAAIVSDAQAPARKALDTHRNPLEYLRNNIVIRDLEEALNRRAKVGVTRKGAHVFSVDFEEIAKHPMGLTHSTAVVDADKGWSVLSLESYDDKNKLNRQITFAYDKQGDGLWFPVKGVHKHWGPKKEPSEVPIFEWRFTTVRARLNDPNFQESVFAVAFEPDTAISDTRYQVAYRIGTQAASGAELVSLAEKAREENQVGAPVSPPSTRLQRRWLVMLNVCFVVGVAALLAVNRLRRSRARRAGKNSV